ncbi:serine/threonine-protein kinase [Actinomadura chibensis]|uniref:serine/threonine-protein kinase n=1 Tax=Actinomadura chibensis TaxID=392828 RepID=UPI00082A878B|nr:serine/threonine-protein kinase [Actinomadura chibensis]
MRPCNRPGCPGVTDETGYCDVCGLPPLVPPARRASRGTDRIVAGALAVREALPAPDVQRPASTTRANGAGRPLPFLPPPPPESRVQSDPRPPRGGRTCGKYGCSAAVGAPIDGRPGPVEGYCPRCGTPFSFKPKLRPGVLLGDQYEVVGCLDRGGLGWVYLAKDQRLEDNLVALKGMINTNDDEALEMMVAERRFLTLLDHPNIVRIVSFVTHPDQSSGGQTGYIVMEYVGGLPLRDILDKARAGERPFGEPLRMEHVLSYGIEILSAFEYLHDRGLLYCDMKPDNVIHIRDRVKLIDLGAVRRMDDRESRIIGTEKYQAPDEEILTRGPSVESDLYTLGKTLEELFAVAEGFGDGGEPGAESCRRIVVRATHPEPERRFRSAAEMAEQARGVRREILSLRDRVPRPEPSARFAPTTALLDAGLGLVPPLERWLAPGRGTAVWDTGGLPEPPDAVACLPAPLTDPADPAADDLAKLETSDPGRRVERLSEFDPSSAEVQLHLCRAHVELGGDDLAKAALALRAAASAAGDADWRVLWHRGLLALAKGEVEAAGAEFDAVYSALPGEDAPKLALGFCLERRGEPDAAERHYESVWRRDGAQVGAAFGLARIRLARGRRRDAAEVLGEVGKGLRHYDAARVAMVRVHLLDPPGAQGEERPTTADFEEALRRLSGLELEGGADGDSHTRLVALIQETALRRLPEVEGRDFGAVLGSPATERRLRTLLEASLRKLAQQARSAWDHEILIDRANTVRPRTFQ